MQFLYLIQCQQFHKIGVANDVRGRLAQLATGNPFSLELLAMYGFENANPIELALHQKFANKRVKGEWFLMTQNDLELLANVCKALGGVPTDLPTTPGEEEIEEAEELAEPTEGAKFDYAAMFADGWRMEPSHDGKIKDDGVRHYDYWCWRKRRAGSKGYIYGGRIATLPYPLDEMRRRYG